MILSVLWSREGNLDLKTNQLNIKYVNISDILHYRVLVKYDGWTCNQLNIKYANISDILHYRVPLKYDGWTWRLGLFHQDQDNILLRYDNFLKQIWIFLFVVGSLIFSIYIYIYIYIYRVFQKVRSIFREVIVSDIPNKNVYMNMCPIPNGFRDIAIWLYNRKIVDKKEILRIRTVYNTGIYCSSDRVGTGL